MTKHQNDILGILQEDSRYSAQKIAVMLGLDEAAVKAEIAEMESSGVIIKYTALVNEEKLESDRVQALIEVRVTPQRNRGFDALAEDIKHFDEVKSVFLMSGGYDLSVLIEGKNLKQVALFVSEKLSMLSGVISTATHFVLKKYKVEGVVIDDNEENNRMCYQP